MPGRGAGAGGASSREPQREFREWPTVGGESGRPGRRDAKGYRRTSEERSQNTLGNLNARSVESLRGQYRRVFGREAPAGAKKGRLVNSIYSQSYQRADDRRWQRQLRRGET